MTANLLNRFRQPTGDGDNPLILDGTVETSSGTDLKIKQITVSIGDVSTASSVYIVPRFAGTIVKITLVIGADLSGSDGVLIFHINSVEILTSVIPVFASSVAGDIAQSTPTGANVITASDAIEIENVGNTTNVSIGVVTFEIIPA